MINSSFRYTDPYLKVILIKSTPYEPTYFIEKNSTLTIIDNKGGLEFSKGVFAPNLDLFKTVEKTRKFQPQEESLQYLFVMYSKSTGIYIFNLDFRPLPVDKRVFAPNQDLFRTVEKTK